MNNVDWVSFLHDPHQWLFFVPVVIMLVGVIWVFLPPLKKRKHEKQKLPKELRRYYAALKRGDSDGMKEHLLKNAELCPNRNSYCLTEVFCPECPLANGGLSVRSGRGE